MLVSLGRAPAPTDVAGSLRACHARIRHFTALAARLAEPAEAPVEQVRDAADEVRRYFAEALPLHVADEELTIAPRLRGREVDLDRALDRMAEEHHEHDAPLAALLAICERLVADPGSRDRERAELAAVVDHLRGAFDAHLREEEALVIPAIGRLLGADEQAAVKAAMAERRRTGHGA